MIAESKGLMTPARRKCQAFMTQALAEHWSTRRLAKEAGVTDETAAKVLKEWTQQIQAESAIIISSQLPDLASVARQMQTGHLRMLPRLKTLLERVTRQAELSEDIDPGDLDKLQSALVKHWKHTEAVTGLDVLKQVAVRREAMKEGQPTAWDGVTEIEARPLSIMPEAQPDPDRDLLGDLW
jgi:hypothetical protein